MEEKKLLKKKEKSFIEGNQEHVAQCCNNLGDLYNQEGNYTAAVKEYEQEAKIYEHVGRRLEMAKAHRMAGEMLMMLSEFDNALQHINIYLTTTTRLKNKLEEQRAYATLGRCYLLHGQSTTDVSSSMKQLKNAEKAFIRSLLICKQLTGQINKIELLDMQARIYLNIGVVKEHMEEFEESIVYMEKAIKISKSNDIYELLHQCYISASLLYQYKKNDSALALRFCNMALEVAERLPDKLKKVCETLLTKSEIMIKVGDFQSAKQILNKAYKMNSTDLNDRQNIEKTLKVVVAMCHTLDSLVVTSLNDYTTRKKLYEKLGDGCCILLNYSKAIEFYLKMLECSENNGDCGKDLIPIYISLYQTYKDNKEYDKALENLWKEFELNKHESLEAFNTLCNIGELCELQMKPYWTVHEIYNRARQEAKKIQNLKLEKLAILKLWKLQKKFNMNSMAEELREEAENIGWDIEAAQNESDTEDLDPVDENTPNIGEDICLEDLSDCLSDLEETEKPRQVRTKGTALTIKRNKKGETQLHQACISGNLSLARRLIDQGHSVNVRDHAGWLPLHEACNHGHKDIVELLVDRGGTSTINDKGGTSCDGITPLYDACSNGFLDIAEFLLESGANATLQTDFGDNPLNILDKWRKSEELDSCTQALYESVRNKLSKQLNNIGNSTNTTHLKNDNSLDRLKCLAYTSDLDNDSDVSETMEVASGRHKLGLAGNEISDDESCSIRNVNVLKEKNCTSGSHKANAKEEYKNAMANLKHPNRSSANDPVPTFEQLPKKRTGFLDPEEVDDDNWLDDDLRPEKKKRKCMNMEQIYPSKETRNRTEIKNSKPPLSLPSSACNMDLFDLNSNCSDDNEDAFAVLFDTKKKPKPGTLSTQRKMSRSLSLNSNTSRKSKHQSSLLDNGFCRFRSDSPLSEDGYNNTEPDSTTNPNYISPILNTNLTCNSPDKALTSQCITLTSPVNQTVSFKIKVEDELLLVPVDRKKLNEIDIKWLSEEASRRYYNVVGMKPILRLMTSDGFVFEEADTISAALEENMIAAKVIEWKLAPLVQRYEEISQQLKQEVDSFVRNALEASQISNSILFADLSLTPLDTEPIFKSIMHQSNLRVLDLSNNFIQDDGCKQLAKSLSTLKQLKVLNLQGNCISCEGLEQLLSYIKTSDLNELESINLSYNPLNNQSMHCLEKLCKQSGKLSKLSLGSCGISNFYGFDLNFNELSEIDLSFNNLTSEALVYLFSKLNSSRLEIVNLNFCTNTGHNKYSELFEKGTCEKFKVIELAGCNLIDSDVKNITQYLSKSSELDMINLTENKRLTSVSLQYIVEKLCQVKRFLFDQ